MLRIDDADRVRTITLDRPEKLNALDIDGYDAVTAGLEDAAAADAVSVVVLTGAGRAFCAGADRSLLTGELGPDVGRRASESVRRMILTLTAFPKPALAAVNGPAVGVGATLLLHVDLVYAAASARFRFPFAALGLAPEVGSSVLLPERVGWPRAAWALFSSAWIEATEAEAAGFTAGTFPDADLLDAVHERATVIAGHPLAALVETKRLLVDGRAERLAPVLAREEAAMGRAIRALAGGR